MVEQKQTLVSGMMILEGSLDEKHALDQIELTMEVLESELYSGRESLFHGTVGYRDSVISTVDPVTLIVGESILSIKGSYDFKHSEVEIVVDLENSEDSL